MGREWQRTAMTASRERLSLLMLARTCSKLYKRVGVLPSAYLVSLPYHTTEAPGIRRVAFVEGGGGEEEDGGVDSYQRNVAYESLALLLKVGLLARARGRCRALHFGGCFGMGWPPWDGVF